jgi:sRNA-binding protein
MTEIQSTTDAIARLIELFPACFTPADHERKPLAIGIRDRLFERATGLSKTMMRKALAGYADSTGYLRALTEGAIRIDLDGNPAGIVTPEQAEFAAQRLAAAAAGARCPSKANGEKLPPFPSPRVVDSVPLAPACGPVGATRRLSLSDLKAAAQQRRAALK